MSVHFYRLQKDCASYFRKCRQKYEVDLLLVRDLLNLRCTEGGVYFPVICHIAAFLYRHSE